MFRLNMAIIMALVFGISKITVCHINNINTGTLQHNHTTQREKDETFLTF